MIMQKIPLSKCFVNAEVEEAALRALRSGQYILAKECQAFEAELAAHTGTQHCILGSSWTMIVYMMHLAQGLKPGDEVIVLNPFFPEYRFYVGNHGGRLVPVETAPDFQPDIARIAAAITPRTKALLLNSPNNPTGVVYNAGVLRALDCIIPEPVLIVSDEPYRPLTFDGLTPPETLPLLSRAVLAWSWSKAMAIPGERIGYLAIPPRLPEAAALRDACTFANRILGYINAPAIWQLVVAHAPDAAIDIAPYQARRDLLCDALTSMGYDAPRPQGTFYVFPKTPIPDDVAFVGILQSEGILAVPGAGFGRGGYMRLSLTLPLDSIQHSLAGFERAIRQCR